MPMADVDSYLVKATAVMRSSSRPPIALLPKLPVICAVAVVLALSIAIPHRIAEGGYLTYVSGAWATLADDAAHGVLYRPLVSELGYGGTRYFPLHPILHGALMHLGLAARSAGHLLSL